MTLPEIRILINQLDPEIRSLLMKRMDYSAMAAEAKLAAGETTVYRADREEAVLKRLGRDVPEEKCWIRTDYQRDRDRIIHCKSFRRLKHKTQVFISPAGDHYRTRLTHTLEVAQIGRTIARALRLNEDLTEAMIRGNLNETRMKKLLFQLSKESDDFRILECS